MCGIVGFSWDDKQLIKQATRCIAHRGPDAQATWTDSSMSLGHVRLSIIDLSEASNQPFLGPGGRVLIYNGEIYNYQEVRDELERRGEHFSTSGDTEVLLAAWRVWGSACLEKLNGMFAFAVYEPRSESLTLVRDRFGIKPLFYAMHKEGGKTHLVFASEIAAIRKVHAKLGIKAEVSKQGLRDLLTLRHTLDQTCFAGIKKLPAGHLLRYFTRTGTSQTEQWYLMPKPQTRKVASTEIREALTDAVRLRMIADVPVGFFLSGGIDSGLITTLAVERKKKLGEDPSKVHTFSVGFDHANELDAAQQTADALGTSHHEVHVSDEDTKLFDDILRHTGEPIGQAALLPTWKVSKAARKNVKVVQAGEGADEIFGGYDRYLFLKHGPKVAPIAKFLRSATKDPLVHRTADLVGKSEYQRHISALRVFTNEQIGGPKQDISAYKKYYDGNSLLQRAGRFDIQTLQVNDFFVKADAMPMAHALEERVPFMDHRVVKLGLSVRDRDKIRGKTKKWLLRKSFPQLPKHLKNRKKRGYETPMDKWFAPGGVLREKLEGMLDEKKHSQYDFEKAQALLRQFTGQDSYTSNYFAGQQLFTLYMFELWYRQHFK